VTTEANVSRSSRANNHKTVPHSDVEHARAVKIEDELNARPDVKLTGGRKWLSGPCPRCGGRDRFQVSLVRQRWLCRNCSPRYSDVIGLVQWFDGVGFKDAVKLLCGKPAGDAPAPRAPKDAIEPNMRWAARIWVAASPIEGTLAEVYLRQVRGLEVPEGCSGEVLRFHPACPHIDHSRDPEAHIMLPAMVALFRDAVTDKPVAIHRTALSRDGRKADLPKAKLSLGPIEGAAIKLSPAAQVSRELSISEGVETGLAGLMRGYSPMWVTGSSVGIRFFPVIEQIQRLTVLVDSDAPKADGSRPGPDAAIACSRRWTGAGRKVRRVRPEIEGSDFADIVRGPHD
jgi:hypothetical protein